ncbi:hypothetical protein BDP27DRAFT_1432288 [Rhodocollybia butyracea]|uniref:Uncharacterized protein n=1 Tax=Rhodocollybia butyracea TaxID=206335 RepID=A0A9P5P8H5_9AGAR|nr:hypothetical protein BDP27DRAFT_1432288 [Rhodocollybia butyracea]
MSDQKLSHSVNPLELLAYCAATQPPLALTPMHQQQQQQNYRPQGMARVIAYPAQREGQGPPRHRSEVGTHVHPSQREGQGPSGHRFEVGTHAHAPHASRGRAPSSALPRRPEETMLFPSGTTMSFNPPPRPFVLTSQYLSDNAGRPPPSPLVLQILPRRQETCKLDEPVIFTSRGFPGPYLVDLLGNTPQLDDPNTPVFASYGMSRLQWLFDFPGLTPITERTPLVEGTPRRDLTRLEIAQNLSAAIVRLMRKYGGQLQGGGERWCDYRNLRLVALIYQGPSWAPVLAVDARR